MSVLFDRRDCGNGVFSTEITDAKFKSYMIFVKMNIPPDKEKEALCSLALDIVATSNRKYPEKEQLSKVLTGLYSSSLGSNYGRVGDYYSLCFTVGTNCDEYTLNGEKASEQIADILLDCLFDPYLENGAFSRKYFELCRQDILDDIEAVINNKRRYANVLFKKIAFEGEAYSLSMNDYKDTLLAADPVSVYKAYLEMLRTAQIEISFCGGPCPDNVKKRIIDTFVSYKRDPVCKDVYISPSPLKSEVRRESVTAEASQCQLLMAYKILDYNEYASKLFTAMLSLTPTSKLFVNVREKRSLCYYCDAFLCDLKNTMIVNTGLAEENLVEAEEAVKEQFKALADGDFTDEEMDEAKLSVSDGYLSNYDSKFSMYFWYSYQINRGTNDSPEDKIRKINALTREDIIAEAKKYKLDSVFILKPEKGGEADEV